IIGLGGVAGGAFGSIFLRAFLEDLTLPGWLWVCAGIALLIVGFAWGAGRIFERRESQATAQAEPAPVEQTSKKDAALEAARMVFRSRYLLAIVAIVGLYEMVSTIMDFQFT